MTLSARVRWVVFTPLVGACRRRPIRGQHASTRIDLLLLGPLYDLCAHTHTHTQTRRPTHPYENKQTTANSHADKRRQTHTRPPAGASDASYRLLTSPFVSGCIPPQEDAAPLRRYPRACGGGGGVARTRCRREREGQWRVRRPVAIFGNGRPVVWRLEWRKVI